MKSITKKISKYNFSSRSGQKIKYIVMHFTGNKTDTALNNANYFGGGNRDASAHYFVDNDNIVQVVEETNASWHCGDGNGKYSITNQNSIGIEMCGTNGEIAKDTGSNTIDLVKQLMKKYDIPNDRVVRHYDASRKNCPSPWSKNNWSRWNDFKKKLTDNKPNKPISKELYRVRKSWKDVSSQKGAYSIKENAIDECKKYSGYDVYDSHGNSVYSSGRTQSIPGPTPSQNPSKEKIDLFSRVAVKGRGLNYYDWVKNLEDYTGDMKNPCCIFMAYPSKGEVRFRVSPISEGRYYSEIQNYYFSKGNYDEAGLPNVPFDKIQMRFDLPGYKIRYRAMCNGHWLDWVENGNSYMEGHNGYAGLGDGTPITAIECEIVLDN
ncbi:peptidoglycan recognition protein family protein [Clostridium sulfidigenes]|uniref:peptidoglycan recognition protein family protein n=1 Tax=Clostridium sulfidigenes TaxID=318464 RepID=UPI000A0043AB|nr:peptidoglycan recognition family protein [Clostridium sulfidigenes]